MTNSKLLFPVLFQTALIALLCCFVFSANAQTSTWTGSSDSDWENAANWNNGVPGTAFDVFIPVSSNDPEIEFGTTASVKSITVLSGATLINAYDLFINGSTGAALTNEGTVINNGALRIGETLAVGGVAIVNNGIFTNSLLLTIGLGAPIGGQGIKNNGTFHNLPSTFGYISIDNTGGHFVANESGIFSNEGDLFLGLGVGNTAGQAIVNQAVFNNSPACSAEIVLQSDDRIRDLGTFTNDGLIREQTIQNCDIAVNNGIIINLGGGGFSIGTNNGTLSKTIFTWTGCQNIDWFNGNNWVAGLLPNSSADVVIANGPYPPNITNGANISLRSLDISSNAAFIIDDGVTLNINNAAADGLRVRTLGGFVNRGTINLGNIQPIGEDGIRNDGYFQNESTGMINIDRITAVGIRNMTEMFNNIGTINIGSSGDIGRHGIVNRAKFNNIGLLKIDRTALNGIYHRSDFFVNTGTLLLGTTAMINDSGIRNENVFYNIGGTIEVEQANIGVNNASTGVFDNRNVATLQIGNQVTSSALQNLGVFNNQSCGRVYLFEEFNNAAGGTFNNDGLLSVQTMTNGVNDATFINDGIIEDVYGVLPNSITNNSIWLKPKNADCTGTVIDAFKLGSTSGYTVGTTWYTDQTLTTPAGTYNPENNQFQATVGSGAFTFYLGIDEDPVACPLVVSIQVNIAEDDEAPSITCPGNLVQEADANCESTVPDLTDDATVSDNCSSTIIISQTPVVGTTIGPGTTIVTLTATDKAGNATDCDVEIRVVGDWLNNLIVPSNFSVGAISNCQAPAPDLTNLTFAPEYNCFGLDNLTVSQDPAPGTIFDEGTTSVFVVVTDISGVSLSYSVEVTVVDDEAPNFACPAPVTQSAGGFCEGLVPDFTEATRAMATDNCTSPENITITQDVLAGSTIGLGTTVVNLTVEDESGNSGTCWTSITIVDDEAPVIGCPAPVTQSAGGACEGLVPDFAGITEADDSCTSPENITITQDVLAGSTIGLGTTVVILTAEDESGNTSEPCWTSITIVDDEAPNFACPAPVTQSAGGFCEGLVPDFTEATRAMATDNCTSPENITITQDVLAGSAIGLGTTVAYLTVEDESGNSGTCWTSVTVVDDTPPVAGCQDITVELDDAGSVSISAEEVELGSTDNCFIASVSVSPSSFGCDEVGVNTVILTVEDGTGNLHVCTAFVRVEDNNPDADTDGIGDVCDPVFDIDIITENTITYIEDLGLNNGNTNALTGKLEDALDKYCAGKVNQALNKLNAFINQVNAFVNAGTLTAGAGADLIAAAQAIIDAINDGTVECPNANLIMQPSQSETFAVITLFPNPAKQMITLDFAEEMAETTILRLRNSQGQLLEQQQLNTPGFRFQWNIGHLTDGLYFIEIQAQGQKVEVRRFVKN